MLRFVPLLVLFALATAGAPPYNKLSKTRLSDLKTHDAQYKRPTGERLPNSIIPKKYTLDITVTQADLINAYFSGKATIIFDLASEVNSFPIHAKYLGIEEVKLTGADFDGAITTAIDVGNEFLIITSETAIPPNTYSLNITYTGVLSSTDVEGFYQSTYVNGEGNRIYLATTHFEEMGARRAFPCFDEPALKATFEISITFPENYTALSNMDINDDGIIDLGTGLKKVTFKETPVMSTYLVAFIVSDFICVRDQQPGNTRIDICGRPGSENFMQLALEVSPAALDAMRSFTGVDYNSMSIGKLTEAAIPDFVLGGMENWGMVIYREPGLLWSQDDSSNYYKQRVVTLVTHELSHQWFGDLVTLDWWSDIFLNEGFATYFEYHVADLIVAPWEMTKQFVLEELQPVLVSDSSNSSLPLSFDTTDPDFIQGRFDDISYNKGGSIIRMAQHALGLDSFKQGLNEYLTNNIIGTPQIVWSTLGRQKNSQTFLAPFETIMENWTMKAGYPVLDVSLMDDATSVFISQQRFVMDGENDDTKWYVPITYTTSYDVVNFYSTTTQAWLTPDKDIVLSLDPFDWIVLNNQQVGYYRVNYDNNLLGKISQALNSDITVIDEISRSQLVDDQMNLARANVKDYGEVLDFLSFLNSDDSYYSWSSAFNGFSYLLQKTRDPEIKDKLIGYIRGHMEVLLNSVPVTHEDKTDQIYTLNQVKALTWACNLGEENCVNDAIERFLNYSENGVVPRPNLRTIVYCIGLRNSNNPENDFNLVYNKYLTTTLGTEQLTILQSLGCVNNPEIRKNYLQTALSPDVRIQDTTYVFSSVYSNNPTGPSEVTEFLLNNYVSFEPHFGMQNPLLSLIYTVADLFTMQEEIDQLAQFLIINDLDESVRGAVEGAIASATANLQTIERIEESLRAYFDAK